MAGVLDIAIKMDPDRDWDPRAGDHYTDSYIDIVDWEELFFNTLGAPHWEEYVDGEDIWGYEDRQRTRFQTALAGMGYPLLSRIWRIFRDVSYYPLEIEELRSECVAVKQNTREDRVQPVMDRIICACDQAIDCGAGLIFVSH
jgi:hypothetical protein